MISLSWPGSTHERMSPPGTSIHTVTIAHRPVSAKAISTTFQVQLFRDAIPLPGFRQFLDHVLSRQHAGAEFPPVLVGVDGFLVAQFEHVSALLAEVDV